MPTDDMQQCNGLRDFSGSFDLQRPSISHRTAALNHEMKQKYRILYGHGPLSPNSVPRDVVLGQDYLPVHQRDDGFAANLRDILNALTNLQASGQSPELQPEHSHQRTSRQPQQGAHLRSRSVGKGKDGMSGQPSRQSRSHPSQQSVGARHGHGSLETRQGHSGRTTVTQREQRIFPAGAGAAAVRLARLESTSGKQPPSSGFHSQRRPVPLASAHNRRAMTVQARSLLSPQELTDANMEFLAGLMDESEPTPYLDAETTSCVSASSGASSSSSSSYASSSSTTSNSSSGSDAMNAPGAYDDNDGGVDEEDEDKDDDNDDDGSPIVGVRRFIPQPCALEVVPSMLELEAVIVANDCGVMNPDADVASNTTLAGSCFMAHCLGLVPPLPLGLVDSMADHGTLVTPGTMLDSPLIIDDGYAVPSAMAELVPSGIPDLADVPDMDDCDALHTTENFSMEQPLPAVPAMQSGHVAAHTSSQRASVNRHRAAPRSSGVTRQPSRHANATGRRRARSAGVAGAAVHNVARHVIRRRMRSARPRFEPLQLSEEQIENLPIWAIRQLVANIEDIRPEHYSLLLRLSEDDVKARHADQDDIATLPVQFADKNVEDTECPICMDVVGVGEAIISLPNCRHLFHAPCIVEYLSKYNSYCPLCKLPVFDR